jgi:hypothetical protein
MFLITSAVSAEPLQTLLHNNNIKTVNNAFAAGEKLTYSISWSDVLEAGVAVLEVKDDTTTEGERTYRIISRTHSVGMVDAFYPVMDIVESVVNADGMYSLLFTLKESHGTKKREREMAFDHKNGKVKVSVNNGVPENFSVPDRVQDALSSLYYVRTRQDFIIGKPIFVDVHDSDKTWSVEIQMLGKEKIKTPAGEFDTIKIKTYPKYEGVFMHKGEIFIWFTDDTRRIPVRMQSRISIGSIMATLSEIQGEKTIDDLNKRTQTTQ